MREKKVRLELDPALEGIEVLIRAPEEDGEVSALLELLGAAPPDTITVFDACDGVPPFPLKTTCLRALPLNS